MASKKEAERSAAVVTLDHVERRIYLIRGQKIMLDRDLASLYGVQTYRLNEAVKRNSDRFPDDFMFRLSSEENEALTSQIAISKVGRGGRRTMPFAFSEQGVAMLSSVLNSARAVQVNIAIMRAFVNMRRVAATSEEINKKLAAIEKKLGDHDNNFKQVFRCDPSHDGSSETTKTDWLYSKEERRLEVMQFLIRTILIGVCLVVLSASSSVSAQNRSCTNQIDRWSSGNELNVSGPVKSIRVEEQIYEFETHFFYPHDKPLLKERFEFDRQGRKIEEYSYTIQGGESPKTTSIYNERGWLIRQDTYSALTHKPYLETRYKYDERGSLLDVGQYSLDDDKLLQRWAFKQDPSRNYFEFTDTDFQNRWRGRVGFTKDSLCRTYETVSFRQDGKLLARTVLTFDAKSNPVTATSFSETNEEIEKRKIEYKFDIHGNWIERSDLAWKESKEKSDWKLMNVVYRKIEYSEAPKVLKK